MRFGIRLDQLPDGTYALLLVLRAGAVYVLKGPMTRKEAELEMQDFYDQFGFGAETAAFHGIEVRRRRRS